ncbi:hypothetical protein LMH87_010669 [Akanthomyces muscarius]|uniref:GATA-type domain-containing protein n=1 Tax=Akanthomyces muscarius TaxID=2231603 RepID=A0A9W8Q9Z9_AKAMU|nr:hypothetical protein LMH87_010669 [Akanthomyces muscarius]KAJ4149895.1 hypothetical protein LMH87_010669 [Akanthomyces muscarius]
MSLIAPIAPHLGLEPLSHCTSSSDVAAHVLAAVSRVSSAADTKPFVAVPAQLSLIGLLQSENVQTIQENLAVLAQFADHLPRDVDISTSRVSNDELLIMGNLVRDIAASLENIGSLRADEDQMLPDIADKYIPMRPVSSVCRQRRKERMKLKMAQKCHRCSRLETPQWRPGPDGPRTLCNVCGLIYTKRQQRYAGK